MRPTNCDGKLETAIAKMTGAWETPVTERQRPMNAGQRQVREAYEANRPTLDPQTQQLWDAYVDARVKALLFPYLKMTVKRIAKNVAPIVKELREKNTKLREDNIALSKEIIKLGDAINESSLVEDTQKLADELANVEKRFTAKIARLRKDVIAQAGSRSSNITNLPALRKQE